MEDCNQAEIFHPASETIKDFSCRLAFQNHNALKAAQEDAQEKASLLDRAYLGPLTFNIVNKSKKID